MFKPFTILLKKKKLLSWVSFKACFPSLCWQGFTGRGIYFSSADEVAHTVTS